jgi:hypothetical protein
MWRFFAGSDAEEAAGKQNPRPVATACKDNLLRWHADISLRGEQQLTGESDEE